MGAHGGAEARDLGEATRDERGARVVAEAEAVGDAGGDGHDVLDRAADLHADEVGAVVHAHPAAVHEGGGLARERRIARRERERARQPARDLLGERRPGERAAARVGTERLLDDLVRKEPAALLEALAQPNERRLLVDLPLCPAIQRPEWRRGTSSAARGFSQGRVTLTPAGISMPGR